MTPNYADLRITYNHATLSRADLAADPFTQFNRWFEDALNANIVEPNAMILATSTSGGVPSARTVLLKGVKKGFCFYTNYDSQKGDELADNPYVALVFLWKELDRQVRVTGWVEKMDKSDSAEYFHSRPRESQIGAWASPQSEVIPNRAALEQILAETNARFADVDPIPLPIFWGGYIVKARSVEFWQGRQSRLHDRFQYTHNEDGWEIVRLAP
jgi:pyridoxamine 5'-phosphate oxidase